MKKTLKLTSIFFTVLCIIMSSTVLAKTEETNSFKGKVDVGGYELYIKSVNEKQNNEGQGIDGNFTIIFESGYGDTSEVWSTVQAEMSKTHHTVSYDRAGLGQSDKSPNKRTTLNQVHELHALLQKANIDGPYVLVAHSLGGFNARLFASEYPDEVAGIVFVDCSHEEQNNILLSNFTPEIKELYMSQFTLEGSFEDVCVSSQEVKDTRAALRNIPFTVLSATNHELGDEVEKEWDKMQKDLASLSDDSIHLTVEGSGHSIHAEKPNVVIYAIKEMINRIGNESIEKINQMK